MQPRYVVNRVTYGDYDSPREALNLLTGLHAAFRTLNLQNDFLRKKFDGVLICFLSCFYCVLPFYMQVASATQFYYII